MSILLITLGVVMAYFVTGSLLARWDMPRAIGEATIKRLELYTDSCPNNILHKRGHRVGDICRQCVMRDQYLMIGLWPIFCLLAFVRRSTYAAIDRVDPRVHEEQSKRIRELERELDIR